MSCSDLLTGNVLGVDSNKKWDVDAWNFNPSTHCTDVLAEKTFTICKSQVTLQFRPCYRWISEVKECFADIHHDFLTAKCGLYRDGNLAYTALGPPEMKNMIG